MIGKMGKIVLSGVGWLLLCLTNLMLIYMLIAAPPIHLVYNAVPPAGPSSVYVPGSGFSGFWFHLGALQAIPNLTDYDFYCYSSGCLSVVMAAMNVSIHDAMATTYDIQQSWMAGNISRFELVDLFLDDVLDHSEKTEDRIEHFLPKLNVLVTSRGNGVDVVRASNRQELVSALKQTTWIPFVTGEGLLRSSMQTPMRKRTHENNNFYLDGGFSRMIHPVCQYDLRVPNTWVNMLYTLNPALKREHVVELWHSGKNFEHPLLIQQYS